MILDLLLNKKIFFFFLYGVIQIVHHTSPQRLLLLTLNINIIGSKSAFNGYLPLRVRFIRRSLKNLEKVVLISKILNLLTNFNTLLNRSYLFIMRFTYYQA